MKRIKKDRTSKQDRELVAVELTLVRGGGEPGGVGSGGTGVCGLMDGPGTGGTGTGPR